MKVLLVTAGKGKELTDAVKRIKKTILENTRPPLVIVGTGIKHRKTYNALLPVLKNVPVKFSPICGNIDEVMDDGTVRLGDGLVLPKTDYLEVSRIKGFEPWKFIASLENGTLIIASREFLTALGVDGLYKRCQIYEVMPADSHNWHRFKAIE